jgi:hypothetical protein
MLINSTVNKMKIFIYRLENGQWRESFNIDVDESEVESIY